MKQGIDSAVSLAKAVDNMGYKRIWFAEHHNHDAYASAKNRINCANIY